MKLLEVLGKIHSQRFGTRTDIILIGITEKDISSSNMNFLYAQTKGTYGVSIISFARFQNEFYGLPPNEAALVRRISLQLKTSVSRIYEVWGCQSRECITATVMSMDDLDKKTGDFCEQCQKLFEERVMKKLRK